MHFFLRSLLLGFRDWWSRVTWIFCRSIASVVLTEVARLADASGVELTIGMLAESSHLVSTFAVVAILAHAGCVVDSIQVRTLCDLISMFHFFIRCLGFFQSSF